MIHDEAYPRDLIYSIQHKVILPTGHYANIIVQQAGANFTETFLSKNFLTNCNAEIYFWRLSAGNAYQYYEHFKGLEKLIKSIKEYLPDPVSSMDIDEYFMFFSFYHYYKTDKIYIPNILWCRKMNNTFLFGNPSQFKLTNMDPFISLLECIKPLFDIAEPPIANAIPTVQELF